MSNLPNSEPKTFKTPETPESRSLNEQDKDKAEARDKAKEAAKGSGAHPDDVEDNRDWHTEKQLDHGLKETFPASDPVSINPGAD